MSKKKSTKIIDTIDFGCYPGRLMFIQGYNYKEVMKHLKKSKAPEWREGFKDCEKNYEEGYCGVAIQRVVKDLPKKGDTKNLYYILIPNSNYDMKTVQGMITLSHEVLHICQFFLPDILIRDQEWEAEAYFHTYLMEKITSLVYGSK